MAALEHVPELGDEVELPSGALRVERMDGPRIARVRYLPHDIPSDARVSPNGPSSEERS